MASLPRLTARGLVAGSRATRDRSGPGRGTWVLGSSPALPTHGRRGMQQVHERCTRYAMAQRMHPQHPWEHTGFISRRLAPQTLEMPEMLYKICLVARELDVSYARCSAGVRIGSPSFGASTMQCLASAERCGAPVHPAKKILSWSANRVSARLGQSQRQTPKGRRSAAIRCE